MVGGRGDGPALPAGCIRIAPGDAVVGVDTSVRRGPDPLTSGGPVYIGRRNSLPSAASRTPSSSTVPTVNPGRASPGPTSQRSVRPEVPPTITAVFLSPWKMTPTRLSRESSAW